MSNNQGANPGVATSSFIPKLLKVWNGVDWISASVIFFLQAFHLCNCFLD